MPRPSRWARHGPVPFRRAPSSLPHGRQSRPPRRGPARQELYPTRSSATPGNKPLVQDSPTGKTSRCWSSASISAGSAAQDRRRQDCVSKPPRRGWQSGQRRSSTRRPERMPQPSPPISVPRGRLEGSEAFMRAQRVTAERLAGGDISGYASRRIGLEAARYATLRAEAELQRRTARLVLATLLGVTGDSVLTLGLRLDEALAIGPADPPLDSLRALAIHSRQDIRAIHAEAGASAADARLPGGRRFPVRSRASDSSTSAPRDRNRRPVDLCSSSRCRCPSGTAAAPRRPHSTRRAGSASPKRIGSVASSRARWRPPGPSGEQSANRSRRFVHCWGPPPGGARRRGDGLRGGEITLVEWLDAVRADRRSRVQLCHPRGGLCHSAGRPGTGRRRPSQLRNRVMSFVQCCCAGTVLAGCGGGSRARSRLPLRPAVR